MFPDINQFLHPDLPYQYSSLLLPVSNTQMPDPNPNNDNNHDGASVEIPRRTRGRPRGSKNKPKSSNSNPTRLNQPDPNSPTNRPNHNNHHHQILEIPNGADVISSIAKHALLHKTSLRVVHTSGSVIDVKVRQQNFPSIVNFGGRHDVVSLSAVFINPPIEALTDVAITMSFERGVISGGIVVGPLIACGSVYVLVESISNLTYQRLDFAEQQIRNNIVNTTSSGVEQSLSVDEFFNILMSSSGGLMPF